MQSKRPHPRTLVIFAAANTTRPPSISNSSRYIVSRHHLDPFRPHISALFLTRKSKEAKQVNILSCRPSPCQQLYQPRPPLIRRIITGPTAKHQAVAQELAPNPCSRGHAPAAYPTFHGKDGVPPIPTGAALELINLVWQTIHVIDNHASHLDSEAVAASPDHHPPLQSQLGTHKPSAQAALFCL